ncbi:hypothetical protein Hamer_G018046 [Homarus americanus]|uniref:Uncharacterized protein n=1 Tax=Homarus americanus TaxID=6706 RepID=A0A8J5MZF0_HOMAM|nr:hypothetical protein Hamer_G018046 [Homarus americanus]
MIESGVQEEVPRQESGVQEEIPRPEQEYAVQEEIARPELPKCEIQQCRSSDPAEWEVNADILNYYADHIPSQNLDAEFSKRGRQFGDKKRVLKKTAKEFSKSDYKEEMQAERKRMRKQFFDEGARDETVSTMTASDRFRTQTFYPIVDKLIVQMGRRQEAYSVLCDRFGFLVDKSLSQGKVILKARNLVKTYSSDLEECFADEFLLFSNMYPEEKTRK